MRFFRDRNSRGGANRPGPERDAAVGVFTFRVQVERHHGGWVNLLDRTGTVTDRYQGIIEAHERDLAGVAEQVMERLGGTWAGCRVAFFVGDRRQDRSLHDGDVFGTVELGERRLASGPAHPGRGRSGDPIEPTCSRDDSLADGQVVECGACRNEVTVRQVPERTMVLSTPDTLRGTALSCRHCGRLFCIDCVFPVVDIPVEPQRPQCDRCGGDVGSIGEDSCQITIQGARRPASQSPSPGSRTAAQPRQSTVQDDRTAPQASYAGLTAADLMDRVVACRSARRVEDPAVRGILDRLRRDYGHPSCPFAASLERFAFGTSGPALFQESMEPDEVEIINTIMQRISGSGRD